MSAWLEIAMLVCGLAVAAVRRRTHAILLVGAQSLALGAGAVEIAGGRSADFAVACVVLLAKAFVLPALLLLLLRRTSEPRALMPVFGPAVRLAGCGAAALLATFLVPPLGLGDPRTEKIAVAIVLLGVALVVARRHAVMQLLGLVVAENGLSLLAISVPGGLPYVIDLGALLDLALIVVVASAFAHRIHAELGTGDTALLRSLRD